MQRDKTVNNGQKTIFDAAIVIFNNTIVKNISH